MPFSISQMLGGFRKKETSAKRRERAPHHELRGKASESSLTPLRNKSELNSATARPHLELPSASSRSSKIGASDLAWSLIVRPHISEKSTMLGEGKYALKVSKTASKGDLKRAVGERYGVKVVDVRIMNMPSKQRRRGATIGTKSGFKKAIITLAKGQLINEF